MSGVKYLVVLLDHGAQPPHAVLELVAHGYDLGFVVDDMRRD